MAMEHYQPYDYDWNARNELYDNWINYFTYVFQNMKCCAICGIVKLNHQHRHLKKIKMHIIKKN